MRSMAGNGARRAVLADLRVVRAHRTATTTLLMAAFDQSARLTSRVFENLGFPLPGRRFASSADLRLRIALTRGLNLLRHDDSLVTAYAGAQLS